MPGLYYDKNGNIIDYYTIFNVPYDAPEDTIKSAFRALIKRYHPDTSISHSDSHMEKVELIIRGYRILSDEDARREYDRALFRSRDPRAGSFLVVPKKRVKSWDDWDRHFGPYFDGSAFRAEASAASNLR